MIRDNIGTIAIIIVGVLGYALLFGSFASMMNKVREANEQCEIQAHLGQHVRIKSSPETSGFVFDTVGEPGFCAAKVRFPDGNWRYYNAIELEPVKR
ncbi:hypothetical protein ACLB6G_20550 [Zhengella sp. ZM62]|uniref:hypothetical protein n=1 Tax=Zhengella sedimenti TaxID=3390035 RepID=UPI0039756F6F